MKTEKVIKKRLLIYSDCYIYGGSEKLLSSIILGQTIKDEYDIHFSYRRHKIYEEGLANDYGLKRENFHPLFILSNDSIFHKINIMLSPTFVKKILKSPLWLLKTIGLYTICNFLVMYVFIKKTKPSIIHINNGGYPGAASCNIFVLAAKMAGINNIVYQVNNIAYPHKSKLSKWIDKNIINIFVSYFITASQMAKQALFQNRGFSLDKIVLIPNTILDKEVGQSREDILRELSWPADSFFICQTAFLSQRKGQIFLLEAINKIRLLNKEIFEKIKVAIIGDGEDENRLKQFVKDNNLSDKIAFTGYRSDSFDFINACDVFVLPSIANEDMPLVVLEAMSLGKIIIASRFGGIEEEIENNVSGMLIEPNIDTLSASISESIIKVFTDKSYEQYGLKARERYDKYFSPEIRQLSLLNVYSLGFNNKIE